MNRLMRRLLLNPDAQSAMMRLVADAVPAMIAYFEQGTTECLFANRRYAQYNGMTPQTILGKTVREVVGEATYQKVRPRIEAAMRGLGSVYVREQQMADGSQGFVEVSLVPHFDDDNVQRGTFVLLNDVTSHLNTANALRLSEERMRKFAEATNEGILFHKDMLILDVNDALLRMSGYQRSELIGHKTVEFVPVDWHERMRQQYLSGGEAPYELAMLHRNGREIPLECATRNLQFPEGAQRLVVLRDMTAYKEAQRKINFLALHDALTQLPNRAYLRERMEGILALARRHQQAMAVLFLDLDHFKAVNDSLGHHVGDELLREVARRLQALVRDSDVVSRLGGDEFVVVLSEITSPQDAAGVAQKLLDSVNVPIGVGGHTLHVSPSIGVSLYPEDGGTVDELMRNADSAMYSAKGSGRSNYQFFSRKQV
jgi:diguanylate cyclase (GGDEF)-like protein/PAS domain S-box-containing protein